MRTTTPLGRNILRCRNQALPPSENPPIGKYHVRYNFPCQWVQSSTVVNHVERGIRVLRTLLDRLPAKNAVVRWNESYGWGLDPVCLLLREDYDRLPFQILLNRWNPKESEEEKKEKQMKKEIGAKN